MTGWNNFSSDETERHIVQSCNSLKLRLYYTKETNTLLILISFILCLCKDRLSILTSFTGHFTDIFCIYWKKSTNSDMIGYAFEQDHSDCSLRWIVGDWGGPRRSYYNVPGKRNPLRRFWYCCHSENVSFVTNISNRKDICKLYFFWFFLVTLRDVIGWHLYMSHLYQWEKKIKLRNFSPMNLYSKNMQK